MIKIKRSKYTELTNRKFMSDTELKELKRVLKLAEPRNLRDVTIIWLLIHTGARASEILAIEKRDLDFNEKTVFIHGLKSCKSRPIPLTNHLVKNLKKISAGLKEEERLFPITYQRLNQIWLEYRPCKKSMHSLRHARAVDVLFKTNDVRLVQKLLGHRSISTTGIYLDFTYDVEDFRKILG